MLDAAIANADSRDQLTASRARLVSEALQYAETANDELRDLVHGILPSVLTREGVQAGVDELAASMSIPVKIDIAVHGGGRAQ